LGFGEEQRFIVSVRKLAEVGKQDVSAQELAALLFREFLLQFRIEKGVLFQVSEGGRLECLARNGIGDSGILNLIADIHEKLPDLRFHVPVLYKAQEMMLGRVYLLLGDVKFKVVLVAYNVSFHSKTYRLMKQNDSAWYYDIFCSYLLRIMKQSLLEREVGRNEFSGLEGYKALCVECGKGLYDAFLLIKISDMGLLYESLPPVALLEFMTLFSDKASAALGNKERVYHVGDSGYVLCLRGEKWDIYQRAKLLLSVLNEVLCSKRPLSCPDMDVRAGMYYGDSGDDMERIIEKLFVSAGRACPGDIFVYGQFNVTQEDVDSESLWLLDEDAFDEPVVEEETRANIFADEAVSLSKNEDKAAEPVVVAETKETESVLASLGEAGIGKLLGIGGV